MKDTERWNIFELSRKGPRDGNPFIDVSFRARFRHKHRVVEVDGFYDGGGIYRWSLLSKNDMKSFIEPRRPA